MSTRDYFKMQSINFCYLSFILEVMQSKSVMMNTDHINELTIEGDTIYAITKAGLKELAIDLDPELSTQAIQEWIDKNPTLHKRVIARMEAS